ncbi:MAG: ferrochelatase [Planctomycetia bacterium]|jgi:ferrochelatase
MAKTNYDALLLVSFGGPDRPEAVRPFLENLFRDKPGPPDRIDKAATHYEAIGGASPINMQNRELLRAIVDELRTHGHEMPVYWGNRYWHPMLDDTVRQMAEDEIRHALAFATSAFGSYPSCRQYLEAIEAARESVGETAPKIDKLRLFFNHPRFITAAADRVTEAIDELPEDRRESALLLFTAHNIPQRMADTSPYVDQIRESVRLVAEKLGRSDWDLAYQSGPAEPRSPWLSPRLEDRIVELHKAGKADTLVIIPIGFLSDHMEVLYDLDLQAADLCDELGIVHSRAATVGCHPEFVTMIRELIEERLTDTPDRKAIGQMDTAPDKCRPDCCEA